LFISAKPKKFARKERANFCQPPQGDVLKHKRQNQSQNQHQNTNPKNISVGAASCRPRFLTSGGQNKAEAEAADPNPARTRPTEKLTLISNDTYFYKYERFRPDFIHN
jgi:hypothetical protein